MEQPVARIAGWEHPVVQDEVIDRQGLPFSADLFSRGIPAAVAEGVAHTLESNDVPLDRVSELHARSYEVGNAESVTGIWADRYGNRYTSMSYKGNNFTKPDIFRSSTAPSGFIPYGLQEDDALLRVLKSSRLLREHGIPTEWFVGVMEPAQLPFEGDLVGQHEYKMRLLESKLGVLPLDEMVAIAEALKPMAFFVTARCMEINDRPTDFSEDNSPEAIRRRLGKVFAVYDQLHSQDADYRQLDAESDEDCKYYFTELLPTLQATNLARLHNIGLVHKFPVPGNVTALGSIVDLDSVHGEPLGIGDAPITIADMLHDVHNVFDKDYHGYSQILRHVDRHLGIFANNGYDDLQKMRESFIAAYIAASEQHFEVGEQFALFAETIRVDEEYFLSNAIPDYVKNMFDGDTTGRQEWQQAVAVIGEVMHEARRNRLRMTDAYAMQSRDTNFHTLPEDPAADEESFTNYFRSIVSSAIAKIENDSIDDVMEDLKSGRLDGLVYTLLPEQTSGLKHHQRKLLFMALSAPSTLLFEYADKEENIRPVIDEVHDAIVRLMENPLGPYTRVNFDFEKVHLENQVDSPAEFQGKERTFRRVPYKILRAMPKDQLMKNITEELAESPDFHVEIHDMSDGSDVVPSREIIEMPISTFFTDAELALLERYVSATGDYEYELRGIGRMSYSAAVTIRDKDGVFHVIIKDQQGQN